jgi:hypothetical protein
MFLLIFFLSHLSFCVDAGFPAAPLVWKTLVNQGLLLNNVEIAGRIRMMGC